MYTAEQIKRSLSLPVCTGWDRGFLESILSQMEKGRNLSSKQKQTLGDVLGRNTPRDQEQHEKWEGEYVANYQDRAMVVAAYYAKSPYFRNLSEDVLAGNVPERQKFFKMFSNKYAVKVLEEYDREPKYDVGVYVVPRASLESRHVDFGSPNTPWSTTQDVFSKFVEKGGFVMEACKEIHVAARGAKRYKILPIGATNTIVVEERRIKIKRN